MARALKVFSTPAGFYEAVVAVPSRKAALAVWGVHDELFASGHAREIDDPERVAAALARPGEIVRVPIATPEALVEATARSAPFASKKVKTQRLVALEPRPPPPDRGALTAAEAALVEAERRGREKLAELAQERRALDAREAEAMAAVDRDLQGARGRVVAARDAYVKAGGR